MGDTTPCTIDSALFCTKAQFDQYWAENCAADFSFTNWWNPEKQAEACVDKLTTETGRAHAIREDYSSMCR